MLAVTKVSNEIVRRLMNEAKEALDEIENIISMKADAFLASRSARFSLRYSIVLIVEVLADLSIAILENDFDEVVESYRDAFIKLATKGVISSEYMQTMVRLAGLRNLVVHRYWTIDDVKIYENAKENGVKALKDFMNKVMEYVETKNS
jgi:uncharacterized protein YutE (UPF0331/DUF86 family)